MKPFYFIFEVDPEPENPVIGHVSRAVAHIWTSSPDAGEARNGALRYLESEHWTVTRESQADAPSPEQLAALNTEDLANYEAAQARGIHSKFYYWHRSE